MKFSAKFLISDKVHFIQIFGIHLDEFDPQDQIEFDCDLIIDDALTILEYLLLLLSLPLKMNELDFQNKLTRINVCILL